MKKLYRFISWAALILSAVSGDAAMADGRPVTATLTGAAEAPSPGDPDGTGEAYVTLNPGLNEICYQISVSDIALPATAAHIHIGPEGQAGPVVVPLKAPTAEGFSSDCINAGSELINEIKKNPSDYYVNVHNTVYPAGAVRGQLSK